MTTSSVPSVDEMVAWMAEPPLIVDVPPPDARMPASESVAPLASVKLSAEARLSVVNVALCCAETAPVVWT